jgi:LacI family transcriptional regulator
MTEKIKKATIVDIAKALGISIATVHRALHGHANIKSATKTRVLKMARKLDYKPNLAARYLSSKRTLRISINTLQGKTSFWDEVRAGIEEESKSLDLENVELNFRTYPHLGKSEEVALESALEAGVDGIIAFPSSPQNLKNFMQRTKAKAVPLAFVATDAPGIPRLTVVSIDTKASGFLAADLMGRLLGGKGRVALTMFDTKITEHAEKGDAFVSTLKRYYPAICAEDPIEDHDIEAEAYNKMYSLIRRHPDLAGIYVTTEVSIPVIEAARDLGVLGKLTIVTTDLFPSLVKEIKAGTVAATIYQRPRTQGKMAFRALYEFLVDGSRPPQKTILAPHLVMRGNADSFLQSAPSALVENDGDEQV